MKIFKTIVHPRTLRLMLDHHRRLGVCTPISRSLHSRVDRALVPVLFVRFRSSSWGNGGDRSAGGIRKNTQEMGGYEVTAS